MEWTGPESQVLRKALILLLYLESRLYLKSQMLCEIIVSYPSLPFNFACGGSH